MFVSGDGFMHACLRFCKCLCGFIEVEAELGPFLTPVFKFQSSFFFWLHWVFAAVRRLSVVAANRDYSLVEVQGLLLLQSTGSQ